MKLIIGNKNYSSWSIRPWLVLTHFAIPFDEQVVMLSGEGWRENLRKVSPSGKVPVLIDGDVVVYETIAIIEQVSCYGITQKSGYKHRRYAKEILISPVVNAIALLDHSFIKGVIWRFSDESNSPPQ